MADSECASNVCDKEGGACFAEAAIIYVATTSQPDGACTKAAPCNSFAQAIGQVAGERSVIKAAPGMYEGPMVIDGIAVTILADGAIVQLATTNQSAVSVENEGVARLHEPPALYGSDGGIMCRRRRQA